MLVSSKKVSLRDLYYELDYNDIADLTDIVMCDIYNQNLKLNSITEQLPNKR